MPPETPGTNPTPPDPHSADEPALSAEQRMLVELRDVLYEGSWEDFRNDLLARRAAKPHVFDTVPPNARLAETIDRHLAMIDSLADWETRTRRSLRSTA